MRWALIGQRIKSSEIQQALHRHQKSIDAQSTLWLSRAQAWNFYRLQCRGGITLTTEAFGKRKIFSFTEYTPNEQRSLLHMQSLPVKNMSKWMLLTKDATGTLTWTAASLEQYFHTSLFSSSEAENSGMVLLVDGKVALPSSPSHTASLFNAQETSNPFLIDDALHHTHIITGAPFSHTVESSLSTVWSQFGYTSLKWLPSCDVDGVKGISVLPGQEPHQVLDMEPIDFIHLRQTSSEYQKDILNSAPRWTLLRSLKTPLILHNRRWLTCRQMGLDDDLKMNREKVIQNIRTVSSLGDISADPPYEIWVPCNHKVAYTGKPQRQHIVCKRFFYNFSQLAF